MTTEDRFWRASRAASLNDRLTVKPAKGSDSAPLDGRLAVNPAEAVRLTGLSRSTIYNLLGSGELPSVTVGRRRLIPVSALKKLVGE
jgi:excisionase family DNA binding protein